MDSATEAHIRQLVAWRDHAGELHKQALEALHQAIRDALSDNPDHGDRAALGRIANYKPTQMGRIINAGRDGEPDGQEAPTS